MKTKLIHDKGQIKLILDDPLKSRNDSDILAVLTHHADSGCWLLEDIRLTKSSPVGRYWSQSADAFMATFLPVNESEAAYLKSKLKDYQVEPDGTLLWCTFDGIVKGQPEINGYKPRRYADFDQPGYFSRKDGLQKLTEIKAFWDGINNLDEHWQIENPNAQPSMSDIMFACQIRRLYLDEKITRDQFECMENQMFGSVMAPTNDNKTVYVVEMEFNGNWENVWSTDDEEHSEPTCFATEKEAQDALTAHFSDMRESNVTFDEYQYRVSTQINHDLTIVNEDMNDGPSMF